VFKVSEAMERSLDDMVIVGGWPCFVTDDDMK